MTEKFNSNHFYKADHRTFGGIIYPSDFATDRRGKNHAYGSPIAGRMISDKKFDMQCRRRMTDA